MSTIPASQLVNVTPNVLAAGGAALDLNGLILVNSARVPTGTVQSFPTAAAVSSYFGAASKEAQMATVYFNGYIGATAVPGALLFATYPLTAIGAFLRGGNLSAMSLVQLQQLSGSLNITVDGWPRNVASISLSAAASFSAAALTIQNALNGSAPGNLASFNGSMSGGVMTVTGFTSGTIGIGETVSGTAGIPAGIVVLSQVSGSAGGTGVYTVTGTTTAGTQALTTAATPISVVFDSVSNGFIFSSGATDGASTIAFATGSLATSLLLTQATGAVISQGAAAATPSGFMNTVIAAFQNWALFTTSFDPDNGSGNAQKLLFSAWVSTTNNRYGYVPWDSDITATNQSPASTSLGQLVHAAGYTGVCPVWDTAANGINLAAFVLGTAASINFDQTNGRITFAYKGQAGLIPAVTDPTVASNLLANFYNFYGAYATANQNFQLFQNGQVSGGFLWLDSFVNQIWLNAQLQLALLTYLAGITSVPYNQIGFAGIENAMLTTINQGLDFGAYRSGVVLSSAQINQINTQAGAPVAGTVSTRGWYLQIRDPGPSVRVIRGSPICNFWYADGQAVQRITLNSVDVQ
jgi:hypothetical protein